MGRHVVAKLKWTRFSVRAKLLKSVRHLFFVGLSPTHPQNKLGKQEKKCFCSRPPPLEMNRTGSPLPQWTLILGRNHSLRDSWSKPGPGLSFFRPTETYS